MTKTFDIIIIGAGIFGCALFHELAKLGSKKILLVEKNQIASGTTGQSGGLIRKFYHSAQTVELAQISYDYYQNFNTMVGGNCGFRQTGCYYLLPELLENTQLQINQLNSSGYPITQSNNLYPALFLDMINHQQDIVIFEQYAGCVDTHLATHAWVTSPRNKKGHFKENTRVNRLIIHNNCIQGIETDNDTIYAGQVVLAAGIYNKFLLVTQNIDLPLTVKSFQYHIYKQNTQIKSALLDLRHEIYMVPKINNEIIVGLLNNDTTRFDDNTAPNVDEHQSQLLHELLELRFPWIKKAHRLSDNTAIDCFSEDTQFQFGSVHQIQGLYLAGIGNGGGIKIAPAIAQKLTSFLS